MDDDWNEKRIDIIGSNGNDALHYQELENNKMNYSQHEILDRTDLILDLIQIKLYAHPELTKKQAKKVNKAMDLLSEVYQLAGNEVFKDE